MKIITRLVQFILYLTLSMQVIYAQSVRFDRITTENGLSNNMVHCIIQDHYGFLWIGTNSGLNKYNGYEFTVFSADGEYGRKLSNETVYTLFEDYEKNIWIGTRDGLNKYNYLNEEIEFYFHVPGDSTSLANNHILEICEDQHLNLWIGTKSGITRRTETGKFINYEISNPGVCSIFEDQYGVLWIGNEYGEIFRYNRKLDLFTPVFNQVGVNESEKKENPVFLIKEDREGNLLAGINKGIFKIDRTNQRFSPYIKNFEYPSGFRNNEIHCIYCEKNKVWLGTYGKGVQVLDSESNTWISYLKEPDNPFSISNNDVNEIYLDNSGVIWVATQDGLNKIDPAKDLFLHYQNDPDKENSLSLNYITAFCEVQPDEIWVGTFGGGINILNGDTFTHIMHRENKENTLIDDAIRAITKDHEGNIWIGTRSGVSRYNPLKKEFTSFRHDPFNKNSLSGDDIMSILVDAAGNVLIGTYGSGLNLYDPSTGKFHHYKKNPGNRRSISSNYIRELYEDSKGNIWIGFVENGGINIFDPQTGEFDVILKDGGNPNSLVDNNINSIYEDRDGKVWIATWQGLNQYDPNQGNFRLFTTEDGLPSNKIAEIVQDEEGNIWISSHMGFSKFDPETQTFINYTLSNGVQGNEFNVNASLHASDGKIYFGGTNGFNIIDPDKTYENPYLPSIVFTDFQINNRSVKPGKKSRLEKSINETDEIILKHNDNIISFSFSGLSYSLPQRNKYAYMLEGVDEEWVEQDARLRYASYTNLKPGDYVFKVKASNNDMKWNSEIRTVKLKVLPPPWKTVWAYSFYAAITLGILMLLRRFVLMRERFRNEIVLAKVEKAKVEELNQMKLRFFTNISHEFKTPVSLILAPIEELMNEVNPDWNHVKSHLSLMERNGKRLHRLINQLMEFRKIEQGKAELRVAKGNIISFLRDVIAAFTEMADKKKIEIILEAPSDDLEIFYDYDKLEKIFYNLLSNALKFSKEGGVVTIRVSSDVKPIEKKSPAPMRFINNNGSNTNYIIIQVIDDGAGIPEKHVGKIFDRFFQLEKDIFPGEKKIDMASTGIGLALTKSLVEIHKGSIEVESKVGKGTVFTLRFPLGKELFKDDEIVNEQMLPDEKSIDEFLTDEMKDINASGNESDYDDSVKENLPVILLVEDNPDLRKFLRDNLEQKYIVREAEDGKEGLDLANVIIPDLIIADIMMPVMNGVEMVKQLKANEFTAHIPIIMLTAREGMEDKIEGIEVGAVDYMEKPFSLRLLTAKIRNFIEQRKKLQYELKKKFLMEPKELQIESPEDVFLVKAMEVIEKNISEPEFGVDRFGDAMNMSRMQLYRKLKALTNQSANEFIRSVRLKRAAQLLRQTSAYTISEVTYEVGFNDPKYFSKCFQKEFGVTPTKFIQENTGQVHENI